MSDSASIKSVWPSAQTTSTYLFSASSARLSEVENYLHVVPSSRTLLSIEVRRLLMDSRIAP
jgi:hypothetical protein